MPEHDLVALAERGERFGISWRQGEPESAIAWRGPISRAFAEVRFFRFHPRNLRSIASSWWWHSHEGTPAEIAAYSEERMGIASSLRVGCEE